MHRSIAAAAIALGLGGPAIAADLYHNGQAPAALQSAAVALAPGVYVNIGAGGALTNAHVQQAQTDFALAGPIGDLRIGYDYILPNQRFLVGVFANVSAEESQGKAQGAKVEQVLGYGGGVRAGAIVNNTALIYGLVAYQRKHVGVIDTSFSADINGLQPGAGIEVALGHGITLGAEVTATFYEDWHVGTGHDQAKIGETELAAMGRLGFHPDALWSSLK